MIAITAHDFQFEMVLRSANDARNAKQSIDQCVKKTRSVDHTSGSLCRRTAPAECRRGRWSRCASACSRHWLMKEPSSSCSSQHQPSVIHRMCWNDETHVGLYHPRVIQRHSVTASLKIIKTSWWWFIWVSQPEAGLQRIHTYMHTYSTSKLGLYIKYIYTVKSASGAGSSKVNTVWKSS